MGVRYAKCVAEVARGPARRLRALRAGAALLAVGAATTGLAAEGRRPRPDVGHGYVHEHWSSDDGLPQDTITSLLQTPDGYLWIATYNGLARFDGVRFTVFNTANTPGLASNRITGLWGDPAGNAWAETEDRGVAKLRDGVAVTYAGSKGPDQKACHHATEHDGADWVGGPDGIRRWSGRTVERHTAASGLPSDEVTCLLSTGPGGSLWVGTAGGLARFAQGRWAAFGSKDGVPDGPVISLVRDAEGLLWVATSTGLARHDGSRFQTFTPGAELPADAVPSVIRAARGRGLWVALRGGLAKLEDGAVVRYQVPGASAVDTISESEDGGVWVRSAGSLLRLENGHVRTILDGKSFGARGVQEVLEDREGSLWVGGLLQGLHRLRHSVFTVYGKPEGMIDEEVYGVVEAQDGSLWFGTNGGGVSRLKDGRITNHFSGDSWSLFETRNGALWVGARPVRQRGGLMSLGDAPPGGPQARVLAIHEGTNGALWFGTWEEGLYRLKDGRFAQFTTRDRLSHNRIRAIHEDRSGDLWLGTEGGVTRFRRDHVVATYTKKDGLSDDSVRSIHEDREGVLWFGTYGNGLTRLKDGRFTAITAKQGLLDDVVSQILEDERGNFWLTGNKGIFRVRRQELEDLAAGQLGSVAVVSYGLAEGMRSRECNGGAQPAGIKGRDGRFWIPTAAGVVTFDPNHIRTNDRRPPVHMERVTIDGKDWERVVEPVVPPGRGELEFSYTAPSLLNPEKVRFRHKLEGFDTAWSDATSDRVARYTNIPPGRYRFRVMACNDDGLWNEEGASLAFHLRPHFYQAWWFHALLVAAAFASAFGVHRLRVRQLKAQEATLTRRVNEALEKIKVLRGLVPICAWCKKIRDDSGYWQQLEQYIQKRSEAEFTHGICPACEAAVREARLAKKAEPEGSDGT